MNNRGFTLVELLIVVGIVGVLSTIGVPTFKKMVQKSKKSEAKAALAGLYTAESGFQAEYNTFGNRLSTVGFEIAGGTQHYTVGFPKGDCTTNTIAPATGTTAGTYLNSVYTAYYNETTSLHSSVIEAQGSRKPQACEAGDINAEGTKFTARAVGAISPLAALGQKAELDIWTMNEKREISNTTDGVK